MKTYEIRGNIWPWNGETGSWWFFTIPQDISDEIYFEAKLANFGPRRGFGSIKVVAIIGDSIWETSIFPSSKDKCYILPIKKSIRIAEAIDGNKEIALRLRIL